MKEIFVSVFVAAVITFLGIFMVYEAYKLSKDEK